MTYLSSPSFELPLFMYIDYSPVRIVLIKGIFLKPSVGVNPGHRGLATSPIASRKPIWLHTIVDGLPSPFLGILPENCYVSVLGFPK